MSQIDAPVNPTDRELREGFDTFVEAARRLEDSYAALKQRADEVDVQLANANARLEQTLDEREAVFRALPVGVIAFGINRAQRWSNPEGERVMSAARARGTELLGAEDGDLELDDLRVRVRRVAMPDGGELLVLEDRSRIAHLEREVDRLDRLAGLSELALGVAHEIKNPLNGVLGFASLIERYEEPEQIRRCAGKIAEGMREVDEIVRALLAFARPRGSEVKRCTVGDVVRAAAAEASVPIARIEVRGEITAEIDGPPLTRALANLLRNSAEAGSHGIEIDVSRDGAALVVDVADDGPGVDVQLGARVFEPFVSSKVSGHGLGLALVARILSFLGGSIDLVNPGEVGARFRIRVPQLQPASGDSARG